MVGAGVGLAAIIGTIRFVKGWSLKPMIYASFMHQQLDSYNICME